MRAHAGWHGFCKVSHIVFPPRLGSASRPAAAIWGRISMARSKRHRSLDVSIEYEPRGVDGAPQPELRDVCLYEV